MELQEDHEKLINSLIINVLDWQPLTSFESRNSRKVNDNKIKYGSSGVYLITTKDNLTNNLVDANIGYVGKSSNIFSRVYDVRGGEHGARKYINSKSINPEDVYVKILFTEEQGESLLERLIQEENFKKFGFKFSWREASGGNDGALIRIFNEIDKIENEEDLKKIADYVEEKAILLYKSTWRNK
jgi:hypothetical protein